MQSINTISNTSISLDQVVDFAKGADKAEQAFAAAFANRGEAARRALSALVTYAAQTGYADTLLRNAKKPASKQSDNPVWGKRAKTEKALIAAGVSKTMSRSLCSAAQACVRKHPSLHKADLTVEQAEAVVCAKSETDVDGVKTTVFHVQSVEQAVRRWSQRPETAAKGAAKATGNPAAGAPALPGAPATVSGGKVGTPEPKGTEGHVATTVGQPQDQRAEPEHPTNGKTGDELADAVRQAFRALVKRDAKAAAALLKEMERDLARGTATVPAPSKPKAA